MTDIIPIIPNIPEATQLQISSIHFLESYNQTIPIGFPRLTAALQKKFKSENPILFKNGELWSLDKHRKEVVDWFQIL